MHTLSGMYLSFYSIYFSVTFTNDHRYQQLDTVCIIEKEKNHLIQLLIVCYLTGLQYGQKHL